MPETLQVTQTPSPAPVDTPNIITSLNTDTGPQASPTSFGPDLNGLAQGLESADQDMQTTLYRTRFDRRETQQAQNELTSLSAVNDLDKKYTAMQQNARAAGQSIDPEQFDTAFKTDMQAKADSMPNEMARASFMAKASGIGLGFYKSNLVQMTEQSQKARAQQFSDVANSLYQQVKTGALTLDDGQDRLLKLGASLAPATGAVPGITSQVSSDMVSATVQNIAQTHGPGMAALTVRNGIGGDAIQEPHREILASELDGQQIIANVTRARIAQQNVDALTQKAAAGGFVSNADTAAAAKELADATTATPVDTKAPDLADYLQGRADHLSNLASSLKGPYAEAEYKTAEAMEFANDGKLIEQRLSLMPPDQQALQVNKMADAFGPDNPLVLHAARIANENTELLTPGTDKYDPQAAAMKLPYVQAGYAYAQNALASAVTPQDKGTAQGLLKTAVEQSFSAQRIMGVPAGQEQVLTRQQAEAYGNSLNSPQDYQKLYGNISDTFGSMQTADNRPLSSVALQQVFDKKGIVPGAIQLAALNPNRGDNWAAASYQLPFATNDPRYKALQTAVDGNADFKSFGQAQQADGRWAAQHDQWSAGLAQMAAYQMAQHGITDPGEAVAAAFQNTIAAKYSVIDTNGGNKLAIPKDYAPTTTDATALQDKANVALAQLQQSGAQIGQADNTPADAAMRWQQATKNGYWAYDAGARALVRYQSGPLGTAPFLLDDGKPLAFKADGLKAANVVTPKVITDPTMGEEMWDFFRGREMRDVSYENGPAKLDTDLNTLIPPASPDVLPYFPAKAQPPADAPGSDAAPSSEPKNDPSAFLQYIKAHPASASGGTPSDGAGDGWQRDFEATHYGYADDKRPDRNSRKGIGAFGDNPLTPGAVALSPTLERSMSALPGDVIEMRDDQGNRQYGYFADRTDQKISNDRIDLYDPHGSEAEGVPFNATSYRKVGGGREGLSGKRLAAIGMRNLAQLEGNSNE